MDYTSHVTWVCSKDYPSNVHDVDIIIISNYLLSENFGFYETTVRGMMYYRRALMLQSYLERRPLAGISLSIEWLIVCSDLLWLSERLKHTDVIPFVLTVADYAQNTLPPTQGFELSHEARAQADLKFTYVVSCQIYGQQKQRKAPEAADIALLLQR